jgi:trans-2,3-dihydro-3-hydroxyanthranilate isomerase
LGEGEIGFDAHQPSIASAGLPFAFVPVDGLFTLNQVRPDFSRFAAAFRLERAGVFVYARETADPAHHIQARVFVPDLGVREDPATGSAAAAFAAVAVHFEQPEDGEHEIVVEQGFAIGRPSAISLTLRIVSSALAETRVGGACVKVGEGVLTF